MRKAAIPLIALALIAAACGSDGGGSAPTDPDEVILTIGFEGGFAPVEAVYDPTPQFVLFADGRLVSQGPVITIFPGPLMPNLQEAQLNDDEMAQML